MGAKATADSTTKVGWLKQPYTKWLVGILLLTVVAYSPAFKAEFNNWDDDVYVTQNPVVQEFSGSELSEVFTSFQAGLYQPLVIISLAVDWKLGGGEPFAFHFTNILLHLINTLLVFMLVKRLFESYKLGLLVALLFGIHSMHVESVAWVTERKDVLYAMFYLLAMLQYVKFATQKEWKNYALAVLFFVMALMSKGMAVALVGSLIAIDIFLKRKDSLLKLAAEKLPFLVIGVLFGWITIQGQLDSTALNWNESQGLVRQTVFANYAFVNYLAKMVYPFQMTAVYAYPAAAGEGLGIIWAFLLIKPLVLWGLWKSYWQNRTLFFGLLFFIVNIILVLQILPVNNGFMADRFTYVASIGVFVMIGWTFLHFYEKKTGWRTGLIGVGIAYALLLTISTFQQSKVWTDSETLWTHTIEHGQGNYLAYNNRGLARMVNGDVKNAMSDFNESLKLDTKKAKTWYNRGTVYASTNNIDLAIQDFDQAILLEPKYVDALSNRGLMKAHKGQDEEAILDFDLALSFAPDHANALTNRGVATYNLGRYAQAVPFMDRSIIQDDMNGLAFYIRGLCHAELRNWEPACRDLITAANLRFQGADHAVKKYCTP